MCLEIVRIKMKVLLSCVVLLSICLCQSDALIDINFGSDDLGRVNEFFETLYFNGRPELMQSPTHVANRIVKKSIYGSIKLSGVMLMLVGANLLTAKFEPLVIAPRQQPEIIVIVKSLPPVQCQCNCHCPQQQQCPPQQHQHEQQQFENLLLTNDETSVTDYGCNKTVCWRACFAEKHEKRIPWCFSSPKPQKREYHSCSSAADCSPLWECLEECHF